MLQRNILTGLQQTWLRYLLSGKLRRASIRGDGAMPANFARDSSPARQPPSRSGGDGPTHLAGILPKCDSYRSSSTAHPIRVIEHSVSARIGVPASEFAVWPPMPFSATLRKARARYTKSLIK